MSSKTFKVNVRNISKEEAVLYIQKIRRSMSLTLTPPTSTFLYRYKKENKYLSDFLPSYKECADYWLEKYEEIYKIIYSCKNINRDVELEQRQSFFDKAVMTKNEQRKIEFEQSLFPFTYGRMFTNELMDKIFFKGQEFLDNFWSDNYRFYYNQRPAKVTFKINEETGDISYEIK
jgi:hypothetical protein